MNKKKRIYAYRCIFYFVIENEVVYNKQYQMFKQFLLLTFVNQLHI